MEKIKTHYRKSAEPPQPSVQPSAIEQASVTVGSCRQKREPHPWCEHCVDWKVDTYNQTNANVEPFVQGEQDWEWEIIRDPEFLIWINNFLPDWKSSYSGDIEGMWQAYKAGPKRKIGPTITSERIAEIAAETLEGPQAMAGFNAICKALREAGVRVG